MRYEDKDLLEKYLCMALPYNIKCYVSIKDKVMTLTGKRLNYFCFHDNKWENDYRHEFETVLDPLNSDTYIIKPYLRPMDSMTEEEQSKYFRFKFRFSRVVNEVHLSNYHEWLLRNYFDYMNLINRGLALEAPSDMYK